MAEIKANLNKIRMSPRKVKLVVDLIRGKTLTEAKNQLRFLVKKPAPLILKLLESAGANAKHNFNINDEDSLKISKIIVEAGPTLKRWIPRAMGRATPIRKRTCSVKMVLQTTEKIKEEKKRMVSKPEVLSAEEVAGDSKEKSEQIAEEKNDINAKKVLPARPYGASSQAKKRNFSRQSFGNIKKIFRRKSI